MTCFSFAAVNSFLSSILHWHHCTIFHISTYNSTNYHSTLRKIPGERRCRDMCSSESLYNNPGEWQAQNFFLSVTTMVWDNKQSIDHNIFCCSSMSTSLDLHDSVLQYKRDHPAAAKSLEGISEWKEDISPWNQILSECEFILPVFSSADNFSVMLQFSKYI